MDFNSDFKQPTSALPDFNKDFQETSSPSMQGGFADWFFANTPPGRIMSAFSQGAHDTWGADSLHLDDDIKGALTKSNLLSGFIKNHQTLSKSLNENFIRPLAWEAQTAIGAAAQFLGGTAGAIDQTGEEVQSLGRAISTTPGVSNKILGTAIGGTGEIISAIPTGFLPEVGLIQTATAARARGAIGEGEAGFFNTKEPTPRQKEARIEATINSQDQFGVPEPRTYVPDLDTLARQINPDAFAKYDELVGLQENLRLSRGYLKSQLGKDFKTDRALRTNIEVLPGRLQEVDEKLRDLIPDLSSAREKVTSWLEGEGKYSDMYRDYVQSQAFENYFKLQEIEPEIQQAYERAVELQPDPKISEATQGTLESSNKKPSEVGSEKEGTGSGIPSSSLLKPIEGTGEVKARGLSQNIEAQAIDKGLTLSFGDLPEYRSISVADQAQKAADLVNDNYKLAHDVAMGKKAPPEGLYPESVLVAVEKHALLNNDVDTIRKLATNSKLSTEATTMGQRIRLLAERDQTSPVGIIKDIQDTREARLKSRNKNLKDEVETTKAEIEAEKVKTADNDWDTFLNDIACDY